jgi:hypothetical protein
MPIFAAPQFSGSKSLGNVAVGNLVEGISNPRIEDEE